VDNERARYPCGLRASAQGWPTVDIWSSSAYGWEGHPSHATSELNL
jgi:hypothetical protein